MAFTMKRRLFSLFACGAGFAASCCLWSTMHGADAPASFLSSRIVTESTARVNEASWGQMLRYFTGETRGTKNVLAAVAVVQPGQAVHRAHRHAEEEYLFIAEGSGTWSLDGKELPAKCRDMLYVEPWTYHGLTNTGDKPLVFVVIRFNSKGVEPPPRPDDRPNEL